MKRLKKIAFILLMISMAKVIVACCNCPEQENFLYTLDSITVVNLNNAGQVAVISANNIIPKEAYGMRVQFDLMQTSHVKATGDVFSSAYAECFCAPGTNYLPKDTITSLVITTLYDFDDTHPANSDVTSYFRALDFTTYMTLPQFLAAKDTVYQGTLVTGVSEDLFLLTPPKMAGTHQFKIDVILSNKKILSVPTDAVMLN